MNINQDTKPEKAFYCADGRVFKNLKELAEALKGISPEAYSHHANECRNDFCNWIRDVYGSKQLAERIASAKSSAEAARIVEKALAPKALRKKKKAAVVKIKRTRKKRKKTAAAAAAKKKKEKKKPAVKIKKRRKAKRNSKGKNKLHRHIKTLARILGLIK